MIAKKHMKIAHLKIYLIWHQNFSPTGSSPETHIVFPDQEISYYLTIVPQTSWFCTVHDLCWNEWSIDWDSFWLKDCLWFQPVPFSFHIELVQIKHFGSFDIRRIRRNHCSVNILNDLYISVVTLVKLTPLKILTWYPYLNGWLLHFFMRRVAI